MELMKICLLALLSVTLLAHSVLSIPLADIDTDLDSVEEMEDPWTLFHIPDMDGRDKRNFGGYSIQRHILNGNKNRDENRDRSKSGRVYRIRGGHRLARA